MCGFGLHIPTVIILAMATPRWVFQCEKCPDLKRGNKSKTFASWDAAHTALLNHTKGDPEVHNRDWCRQLYKTLDQEKNAPNGKHIKIAVWDPPPPSTTPKRKWRRTLLREQHELPPIVYIGNIDYDHASLGKINELVEGFTAES